MQPITTQSSWQRYMYPCGFAASVLPAAGIFCYAMYNACNSNTASAAHSNHSIPINATLSTNFNDSQLCLITAITILPIIACLTIGICGACSFAKAVSAATSSSNPQGNTGYEMPLDIV